MKKIIIIVLLCSLFLMCFPGCSVFMDVDEEESDDEVSLTSNDPASETTSDMNTDEEGSSDETIMTSNDPAGETTSDHKEETTSDHKEETASDHRVDEKTKKLYDLFEMIRSDIEAKGRGAKLGFSVLNEELYYELKDSGKYDNTDWNGPFFIVTVKCNYDAATYEDWYKQCAEKNTKTLNKAFYDQYSAGLSKGSYASFSPGMYLTYTSPEDFINDYAAIKALADLKYVRGVHIMYDFGLPLVYMEE